MGVTRSQFSDWNTRGNKDFQVFLRPESASDIPNTIRPFRSRVRLGTMAQFGLNEPSNRHSDAQMVDVLDFTAKHSMSTLADLDFRVEVNREERVVTLVVKEIDSVLICDVVTRILPLDHDVVAFMDELGGPMPSRPRFRLRIKFDGRHFGAEVVKLFNGQSSLRMEPHGVEWQRMARQSAARVLAALHEAGYEAIVADLKDDGTLDTRRGGLHTFTRDSRSDGLVGPAGSAGRAIHGLSEVGAMVVSDYATREATERAFASPHLAWDPVSKTCIERYPAPDGANR